MQHHSFKKILTAPSC